jgi:large subunit ribosomal protein L28
MGILPVHLLIMQDLSLLTWQGTSGLYSFLLPSVDTIIDCTQKTYKLENAMSRVCQLTGKKANNAYAVSHSHIRTKKLQEVNLQWKRVWWAEGKRWVKLRLSTKAIKTLEKKGLAAMAKEAGINLNKF